MGVGVQCESGGEVTQHAGHCLNVHPVLQRQGGEGHGTTPWVIPPASVPGGTCAGRCPVKWDRRWVTGITRGSCPLFFSALSTRLPYPLPGAGCGRRFLFSGCLYHFPVDAGDLSPNRSVASVQQCPPI